MLVVAGLGNPGPKYADTRHNLGFRVVERLAGDVAFRERFHGRWAQVTSAGQSLGLLQPLTYMNESGRSVQAAVAFAKVGVAELIVVHDELDLPFGVVRIKQGGGLAGHNGLRSIRAALGPDFIRVRVGIGRPPPEFRGDGADFVLQAFAPEERPVIADVVGRAAEAVTLIASRGISAAMNATNQRPKP